MGAGSFLSMRTSVPEDAVPVDVAGVQISRPDALRVALGLVLDFVFGVDLDLGGHEAFVVVGIVLDHGRRRT